MGEALVDVAALSIADAGRMLRGREFTSRELTEACLARVAELEPRLNAFITLTADQAIAAARQADAEFARGHDRGPLHGIPVGIKDLCATKGVRTTAGSKVLEGWVPDSDATIVTKLREAGAVSLGKLNLHEFAYGTSSANPWYGPVHNPWNLDCHPGGSSGGSGAAVATGECFAAVGSDTGGSIRIPAALCGVVGLMPTYGLVSRAGVTPLSWSLDHLGPLARTVEDAALFLNAVVGHDPADVASVRRDGFDATAELGRDIRGVRVGVVRSQFARCEPGVVDAVEAALGVLRALGADVRDIPLPMLDAGLRLNTLAVEASAYHFQWLRECPEKYSDEVRRLLLYGLTIPAYEYVNDLRLRREFTGEVRAAMREVDLIAMPTCERVACPISEAREGVYRYSAITAAWDHTGQPVISVPCGYGEGGLPVGLSLAGRPFDEALICRAAQAYEQATPWHTYRPPV
jgi:aspartyl-tRNA(Asn)/glutamyl-tRNA(Gln) amidotransferase subunit A